MKNRLAVIICTCLLALVLVGCTPSDESSTASSAPQTHAEEQEAKQEPIAVQEVLQVDNASVVVPVRDPFVPLIQVSDAGMQPDEGRDTQNSGNTGNTNNTGNPGNPGNTGTEPTNSRQPSIELVAVFEQDGKLCASLRDGSQLADVTVGDVFKGYKVVEINLQNNQLKLDQDGKTVVLNNTQVTK